VAVAFQRKANFNYCQLLDSMMKSGIPGASAQGQVSIFSMQTFFRKNNISVQYDQKNCPLIFFEHVLNCIE
jgi:hypothetical protein